MEFPTTQRVSVRINDGKHFTLYRVKRHKPQLTDTSGRDAFIGIAVQFRKTSPQFSNLTLHGSNLKHLDQRGYDSKAAEEKSQVAREVIGVVRKHGAHLSVLFVILLGYGPAPEKKFCMQSRK